MNLIYNLIIAFAMYSKIPMPHIDWTKERMRYVFCFFPVIGADTVDEDGNESNRQ